ncbi:MAG: hypothetical protein JRJ00_00095 [Deltaproteobacteria bacterium]|nr:hypothetical protein [Deltaproteobacteria bacterium]
MTFTQYYGNCPMCNDDPNVTCTCQKKFLTFTITSYEEPEQDIIIAKKKKKKRMSRIEKQYRYGGK